MKKIFFISALLLCALVIAKAQVTIGSGTLPQATLDIVGSYSNDSEKGKAFRLDDGNQAPGKVLTCGENGVGSWQLSTVSLITGTWDDVNGNEPLSTDIGAPTYTGLSVTLPPGKYMIFVQAGYAVAVNRYFHMYLGWGTTTSSYQYPISNYASCKFLGNAFFPPLPTFNRSINLVKQQNFIIDLTAATEDTTIYILSHRQVISYTAESGIVDDPTDVLVNHYSDEFSLNVISLH